MQAVETFPPITGEIYKVSEISQLVKQQIEEQFPLVWITGEISNFAAPSSGHWYFSLKDEAAQIKCACFQAKRLGDVAFGNGQQVIVQGYLSLYTPRGEFQLIVQKMTPAGAGVLALRFEALKQKLAAEGLFESTHKKPLPESIYNIAVITSPTGAAIQDVLTTLTKRFPLVSVTVYPVAVQGEGASREIAKALMAADQHHHDVILLVRGGGSLEDLWSFNEEVVARAIYACETVVVSGVGHEVDFSIADFVADHRAATPTAAAALVTPQKEELLHRLKLYAQRLQRGIEQRFQSYHQTLDRYQIGLKDPAHTIAAGQAKVALLQNKLGNIMAQRLQQYLLRLSKAEQKLIGLDPLAVLSRGYALVQDQDGHIISKAQECPHPATLTLRFQDGERLVETVR